MSKKRNDKVVKEGDLVDVIPPENRKDLRGVDLKTWLVIGIFNNRGRYPQLPNGPAARLYRGWTDNWILPVSNLKPATNPQAFYA